MVMKVEWLQNQLNAGDRIEPKPFGETLRCPRCNGLMIGEQGFAATLDTGETTVSLRRCVQCGEIVDPVILQNRRAQLGTDLRQMQR